MVAAQRFNEAKQLGISAVYGCVSSGTEWRFLKPEGQTTTIEIDYPLPPVSPVLGLLVWIAREG